MSEENKAVEEQDDKAYDIDYLKVYYGSNYKVSEYIEITQPKVQDLIDFGEQRFWNLAYMFCANSTSMRLPLWDAGLDWCEVSDWKLFLILLHQLKAEDTQLIFKDLDFSQFRPVADENAESEDDIVLVYLPNPLIMIDKTIHARIVRYLRMAFDYHPKKEFASNRVTKQDLIMEERFAKRNQERMAEQNKEKEETSTMLSMVSFALSHPGFKYRKDELNQVGIFEFMDTIKRLQNTENVQALMRGMYSGFMDTSKIDFKKDLNLMRDIHS